MTLSSEVKVGDKIVITDSEYPINTPNGTIMTVVGFTGCYTVAVADYGDGTAWHMTSDAYKLYSKETPMAQMTQEPKLWKDMTPEEKGALLLAHHEGKAIQTNYHPESKYNTWEDNRSPTWSSVCAYRVKPAEPVVETSVLCVDGYKITLTFRDGVVDPIAQVEEL
jgi:hypothetical protein